MRRISLALAMAALSAALFAQAGPAPQKDGQQGPAASNAPGPVSLAETSLVGVLAFVGEDPAIKTDSATVLLVMPNFFKYAYYEGYKAGIAVKAKGILVSPPGGSSLATLFATEVTIGTKTYIIVQAGATADQPEGGDREGPEMAPGPGFSDKGFGPKGLSPAGRMLHPRG